ncbi:MAG: HlyD family secretion protein [Acidobacteriaceae bacterium]
MKIVRFIILVFLLAVIAVGVYWYVTNHPAPAASTALTGSGTVETTEVSVSSEITGRIVAVLVSEGDAVKTGDTLYKLDDSLLKAQLNQAQVNLAAAQSGLEAANTALQAAQAAVSTAQAQYDLALASARQQAQPARQAAWSQPEPSEFDQPVWYFSHTEEITAVLGEVNSASQALDSARTSLSSMVTSATYTNLAATESRLAQARYAFQDAGNVLDRAKTQDNTTLTDVAQQSYDAAKSELDSAQQAYNELLTTQEASDILEARAHLASAQERYDTALDRYNALLTGENSLTVKVAAGAVSQAQANVMATQSKVTQAQSAIDQAQAAINLINVQLGKLVITSPVDGVVLVRNIEPGEIAIAGGTALTLGQLDHLTITVYIPENRYGELAVGDNARVNVDSFPNQSFKATITRIANQAEFTPRNVQTVEGRSTTVYAVELAVENPGGLLKPGMPADVSFNLP